MSCHWFQNVRRVEGIRELYDLRKTDFNDNFRHSCDAEKGTHAPSDLSSRTVSAVVRGWNWV
jgi:hypothetical protein